MAVKFTYKEAVEKVMSLADFERSRSAPEHSSFHLERMSLLFEKHDNVHLITPSIHIAGTNGKGSVSAMIAAALSEAGYLTGLYTSPHLHSVRERIRLNGVSVSEKVFADLVSKTWTEVRNVSNLGGYGGVTTFEIVTLLAIIYFAEQEVDLQVVEVGLGGRLDSTNLVKTEISVITPIGLDHTEILGNTIPKIAREKAGIIKAEVPVIVAPQNPEARKVIGQVANNKRAKLIDVSEECTWMTDNKHFSRQKVNVKTKQQEYKFDLALGGSHQAQNSATSIVALEQLSNKGYDIFDSPDILSNAWVKLDWPGRMEHIKFNDKRILLDGAHNELAIEQLVASIIRTHRKTIIVFGSLLGHQLNPMMGLLKKLGAGLVIVKSRHPKALGCLEIEKVAQKVGINILGSHETVSSGIKLAIKASTKQEEILVTGSFSVVAEAREYVLGINPELYTNIRIVEKPGI